MSITLRCPWSPVSGDPSSSRVMLSLSVVMEKFQELKQALKDAKLRRSPIGSFFRVPTEKVNNDDDAKDELHGLTEEAQDEISGEVAAALLEAADAIGRLLNTMG
eukprot:3780869-Rhodomonas_salina.2